MVDAAANGENTPASNTNSSVLAISRCISPYAERKRVSRVTEGSRSHPSRDPAQESACRKHRAVLELEQSPWGGRQKFDIRGWANQWASVSRQNVYTGVGSRARAPALHSSDGRGPFVTAQGSQPVPTMSRTSSEKLSPRIIRL